MASDVDILWVHNQEIKHHYNMHKRQKNQAQDIAANQLTGACRYSDTRRRLWNNTWEHTVNIS